MAMLGAVASMARTSPPRRASVWSQRVPRAHFSPCYCRYRLGHRALNRVQRPQIDDQADLQIEGLVDLPSPDTHLSQQSPTTSHIQTPHALQPLSGALGRLALSVLMPSLKSPFGFVIGVKSDLLANKFNTLGVHAVQQAKLALLVPPVLAQLREVRDLVGVDRVEVSLLVERLPRSHGPTGHGKARWPRDGRAEGSRPSGCS